MGLLDAFNSKVDRIRRKKRTNLVQDFYNGLNKKQRKRKIKGEIYRW